MTDPKSTRRPSTLPHWLGIALTLAPLASLGVSGDAAAQTKPKEAETALTDEARVLYERGRAAVAKGRWQDAYAAFLSAWMLKRHYQIAGNLGIAELTLKKYRDAAEHLSFALVDAGKSGASPDTLTETRRYLEQAAREVATVHVEVNQPGARVVVDGVDIGESPLLSDVFLEPGSHVVQATKEGFVKSEKRVEATKGGSDRIVLSLVAEGPPPVPSTSASVAVPAPSASATLPPSSWPRTEVLIGGGVVAGLALGGAVLTTVLANGKASDRDEALAELRTGGDQNPCFGQSVPSACSDVYDAADGSDSYANIAVPLYVVGGVALIGTLAVLLLTDAPKAGESAWAPMVDSNTGGIVYLGQF